MIDIIVGYLTQYDKPRFFIFHWFAKEFGGASLQLYKAWTASDLLTCPFNFFTYPFAHTPKTYTISYLLIIYTLSLCPK
jgi:hypothetical protein